jgi:iron only hydrogenase large subunit
MDDTHSTAGPLPRPSFAVIGADAFLAARPATPVQVVHACSRAGYDATVPATWGDELIAARCVERLADRSLAPAVFCACSLVRDRLLAPGPDLLPFVLSFVSPPVATARYLRQLYAGRAIDITFVGACPSADDEAIDRVVTPVAFFAELRARGISLSHQPTVFDSTFAPDRRRCVSQPGGLPVPALLDNHAVHRRIIEIGGFEYAADLAQHLIMSEPVLIDISARSGCACAGAAVGVPPLETRRTIVVLEPPRSAQPIVEPGVQVMVDLPLAPPPGGDSPRPAFIEPEPATTRETDTPAPTIEAPATRKMERRVGERRRVFDHTFDLQFDSAFREAFDGAADVVGAIKPAELLVAVAERTAVDSVVHLRRQDDAATATALAGHHRRGPADLPVVLIADLAPPVEQVDDFQFTTPEFDTARMYASPNPGTDRAVRIPLGREPRPVRRAPRVIETKPPHWLRRIPASTYIVSLAAVTAAAVFVSVTVHARHTFQLTAVQQSHPAQQQP